MVTGERERRSWRSVCRLALVLSIRLEKYSESLTRVSDQNGISRRYIIVQIYHSGRKPSNYNCDGRYMAPDEIKR